MKKSAGVLRGIVVFSAVFWAFGGAAANAAVSDHVFLVDIAHETIYKNAIDETDVQHEFFIEIETDADVNFVEVLTPEGITFEIPDIADSWTGDANGGVWTTHEYDSDPNVWIWDYSEWSVDPAVYDDYGDGTYTVTVHYESGGQDTTSFWFGVPSTSDPLPWPTQRPIMTSPGYYSSATSPVTVVWEDCTDPNVRGLWVELESKDTYDEMEFAPEDTNWPSVSLSNGFWKASIWFDQAYWWQINGDGIDYGAVKSVASEYWFAVGKAWAAYELWAGTTDYTSEPNFWERYYNIDQQDYVKIGESRGGSATFSGDYDYYVIAVRQRHVGVDAIRGSNGTYYLGGGATGNVLDPGNINGAPDQLYTLTGLYELPASFSSYIVLTNPGTWTGLTVISTTTDHTIWYVDGAQSASGDGASWPEAFKTIPEAITAASAGDEIWVKAGTYSISSTINVNKAVGIYGGFAGGETGRDQRNWVNNQTIIDGGGTTIHCVRLTGDADFDGLVIQDGNSVGTIPNDEGGGMYIDLCDPNIAHCTFRNNHAEYRGGGVYAQFSNGTFSNCTFTGNAAGSYGGAMTNYQSELTITGCTFTNNQGLPGSSTSGGAIYNHTCTPTITGCTFTGNRATNGAGVYTSGGYIGNCTFSDCNSASNKGGGIYGGGDSLVIESCLFEGNQVGWAGGALYISKGDVINCIMSGNGSAFYGGAIYVDDNGEPNVTNCTIYGNTAGSNGGAVHNTWAVPLFTNCIIRGNSAPANPEINNSYPASPAVANYCDIEGGYSGVNNIDVDPNFLNPAAEDFRLTEGSACIDTGDNSAPGIPLNDYAGNTRIFDGDGDTTATVDMGAYEFHGSEGYYLLAETFSDGDYSGWAVMDDGTSYGPSSWSAATGELIQGSNIFGGDGVSPDMPGTYAVYEDGVGWDDYIMSVTVSSDDDDAIGVMFRYVDSDNYYRFSWDKQRKYRRLVKKEDGVFTILAQDSAAYVTGQSYELEIIACGPSLGVFIDQQLIFWTSDWSFETGSVGLYSWGNAGAHFDDVVVEEFPVEYGTEDFSDGGYEGWTIVDEGGSFGPSSWSAATGELVQGSNIFGGDGVSVNMPGTYALYEQGFALDDYTVTLTLSSDDDDAIGVMFHYIDNDNYYRLSWDKQRSYRRLVKRENGVFTVLAQDNIPYVTGQSYQVQIVTFWPTIQVYVDGQMIFWTSDWSFMTGSIALYCWGNAGGHFDNIVVQGVVSSPGSDDFSDNNYDGWRIVNNGTLYGPSVWSAATGELVQSSNVFGGDGVSVDMPGTYAVREDGYAWEDYAVSLTMSSDDDDGIGVMFRYVDDDNYYRFSWDKQRSYRRLVKKENGVFTLLAQDNVPYVTGQSYAVDIAIEGPSIGVLVDNEVVFLSSDYSFESGSVGLYSWGNAGAHFDDVVVQGLESYPASDDFGDGDYSGWTIVDEGGSYAPSSWSAATGTLVQSSNIFGGDSVSPDMPGTYAVYEDGFGWEDCLVSLTLRSDDDDAIGVMFRYIDNDNYYRFSWDKQRSYRRLVKKENGVFTVLAQENVAYVTGQSYQLNIVLAWPVVGVLIDDEVVFWTTDSTFASGSIGLYSWGNAGSRFDDIVVSELSASDASDDFDDGNYDGWALVDEGTSYTPSSWSAATGQMVQSSNIFGGDGLSPAMPGTYALYDNGFGWRNYAVDVTLSSDDDDAIGVMFRYQDNDNYYRFSWDKQRSYRRLVKKEGGVFTVLAQDNVPYVTGQAYQLEIVADGPVLQVFIDDQIIFWAGDYSLESGTVALYSWGNAGARFDGVGVEVWEGDDD